MDKERIILPDAEDIAPEEIAPMMAHLAAMQSLLAMRLIERKEDGDAGGGGDHLLDIAQAAQKLKTSKDWLYRNKHLPFVVRIGRQVRFSERGIDLYIRQRAGR
ncbi:MAG TPA: helix-turn-helix domain-containing protein [Blastocatellia bacterium]|jgi:predicted DNA-binding transcriptional regulator AlpA|nr:helix-turn-helix domain-containing protein [Blastocatellia bacterium]